MSTLVDKFADGLTWSVQFLDWGMHVVGVYVVPVKHVDVGLPLLHVHVFGCLCARESPDNCLYVGALLSAV